jgi:ornithine lipid ester-linked acyl 2-hydroxylase
MFINPADYPFTAELEAAYLPIRKEMETLSPGIFTEWPQKFLYESGWNVFGLYAYGKKLDRNCSLCPQTTQAVEKIPGLFIAGFSWLEAGTHIKPHVGYTKAVLRCHLGLVVPNGCVMRVGDESRTWQEGKTLIFDDTTEHEVWNRSPSTRVVLLLDFKRPGQDPDVELEAPNWVRQRVSV